MFPCVTVSSESILYGVPLIDLYIPLCPSDAADVSLVDSAPQSLPGESELLSLDSAMLAALAEARRQPAPSRTPLPGSPVDSSFPAPTGPSAVCSPAPTGPSAVCSPAPTGPSAVCSPAPTGPSAVCSPAPTGPSAVCSPAPTGPSAVCSPAPTGPSAVYSPAPTGPSAVCSPAPTGPSAVRSLRSASAAAVAQVAATAAGALTPPPPPPPADDAGYADLCQQASAEQRELERQADEEYENRQFEHLERRVSRENVLDTDPESCTEPAAQGEDPEADSTGGRRQGHPRSQLSRKETYICRPNTGTFKIDKKQRFGTFKVDKAGTFKVPRPSACAARSLPPESAPGAPRPAARGNGDRETTAPVERTRGDTPASDLNGGSGPPSDSINNTFCHFDDECEEVSYG